MRRGRGDADRLVAIVKRFAGRRVVVLGDLIADEFVYGDIARVSREAPVLVLDHRRTVIVPGGGANSSANLRSLGANPIPVGVVGQDESGRRLVAAFRELGISVARVRSVPGYATPSKSRIMAGGVHTRRQQVVRLDRGAPRGDFPPAVRARLRRAFDAALVRAEALLVADYGYGTATPAELDLARRRLGDAGIPVTVDSRSKVAAFRAVSACTPNQEELEQAVNRVLGDDSEVLRAGRSLLRKTANRAVLVTRGSKGMTLFQPRHSPLAIAAYGSDEVADVTGAGDTVIATFTLALAAGADTVDAARLSNYAAGLVVAKVGTATVCQKELVEAIVEDHA